MNGNRKDKDETEGAPSHGQILVYAAEDGRLKLEVRLENESVWLTQRLMAELFQKDVRTINHHIQSIYDEGELTREATIRKYRIVQAEGSRDVSREIEYYNLDMIISVGYRVTSTVATRFRIWATQRLREYIVKGFVLDDERLKNPDQPFDYFEELLRRNTADFTPNGFHKPTKRGPTSTKPSNNFRLLPRKRGGRSERTFSRRFAGRHLRKHRKARKTRKWAQRQHIVLAPFVIFVV